MIELISWIELSCDIELEDIADVFCRLSREQAIAGDVRDIRERPNYDSFQFMFHLLYSYVRRENTVDTVQGGMILLDLV